MAPVITIGRLGIDSAAGPVWNGRTATIAGELIADDLDELVAKRQAAIGLADNPHEPIVPLAYTEDPSIDGYCHVDSVAIDTIPAALSAFWLPITVTATMVPSPATPVHESRHRGTVRTNDHSIDDGDIRTWHGIPDAYEGYFETFSNRDDMTRESETGLVKVWFGGTGVGRDHYLDAVHGYHVPPAHHYDGAAELRVAGVPQVGEWVPNEPTDWELTNGIIGIRPAATAGRLTLRLYDPDGNDYSAAADARDFVLGHESGGTFYPFHVDPHTLKVIRNRPELVHIEAMFTGPVVGGLSDEFAYSVAFLIRRGANYIEGYLDGLGTVAAWGIERDSAEAASPLTAGGIIADAPDAQGNSYLVLTPLAFTDLTSGLYIDTPAEAFPFALGYEIGAGADLDDGQATSYAYHAAHYERTTVVGR